MPDPPTPSVPEQRKGRIDLQMGHLVPPHNALYKGEVADGGARIRVWATPERWGITVAHLIRERSIDWDGKGPEYRIHGDATLSIGGGLSLEQAEALIAELTLAIRAKRLHDGEPWQGREVAPGVVRVPS